MLRAAETKFSESQPLLAYNVQCELFYYSVSFKFSTTALDLQNDARAWSGVQQRAKCVQVNSRLRFSLWYLIPIKKIKSIFVAHPAKNFDLSWDNRNLRRNQDTCVNNLHTLTNFIDLLTAEQTITLTACNPSPKTLRRTPSRKHDASNTFSIVAPQHFEHIRKVELLPCQCCFRAFQHYQLQIWLKTGNNFWLKICIERCK